MSAKFTPGPWFVAKAVDEGIVIDMGTQRIADCNWMRGPEDKANARLIAAAPDLFEALMQLVGVLESDALQGVFTFFHVHGQEYKGPIADMDAARAAIAKAEGT